MTFATLYIDERNLLNFYAERDAVEAAVLEVVRGEPQVAEDFGYLAFDEDGDLQGQFVSGAELLARRRAPA